MATVLRFVVLDEHKGNGFDELRQAIEKANKSVGRNEAALKSQGKAAAAAQGGILSLVGAVSGFGDASTVGSKKASLFARGLAAVNLATGVLEPALAGVVVAVGALGAAAAAAGAGLAAYGIAAKPLFAETSNALKAQQKAQTAVTAANQQYQAAIASGASKKAAEATRTRAIALAHKQLAAVMKTLPEPVRNFAAQVKRTQDGYKAWANSLSRPILRPLTLALRLVHPILVAISPLARKAAGAIRQLVGELGQMILSPRFEQQIRVLLPHVRPAILGLAHAFGNVAAGIWGVVKAFLPMSDTVLGGVTKLTAKFREWGQSLPSHSGFQSLMDMFRTSTPKAVAVLKNLAEIIKNVAAATVGLATPANSQALLNILGPLTQIVAQLSKNQALVRFVIYALLLNSALKKVGLGFTAASAGLSGFIGAGRGLANLARGFNSVESAAAASTGTMGTLGGKLKTVKSFVVSTVSALAATSVAWAQNTAAMVASKAAAAAVFVWQKLLTAGQWLLNAAMAANPIGLIVIALAALGVAFYLAWTKSATFRKILIAAWNDIWKVTSQVVKNVIHAAGNFWHALVFAFNTVRTWVKKNWPWLLGALTGPIGLAVVWIIKHWRGLVSTLTGLFNSFRRTVANVWDTIWRNTVTRVRNGIDSVTGWFRRLPGRVINALMGLGTSLWHFANQAFTKFWNGFKSVAGSIINWVKHLAGLILGALNKIFNFGSPSKTMFKLGQNIMLGLLHGLRSKARHVQREWGGAVGSLGGPTSASARQAQAYARSRLGAYGWGADQMVPLILLWNQESGWNRFARNPSSGAYGIPQALPPGKMGAAANPPTSSAAAQINWGLNYIKTRPGYGSPAAAWAHEQRFNWYRRGTKGAAPGWAWVGERGPELVRMRGGETVLPHAASRMVAGYAKGTKDTIAEQVHKALRVIRRRPHLPELIHRLQHRLGKLTGRIVDERQLAGHVHGAARRRVERELHRDEHHRRLMRRRLRDATHDRGIVEHAGHSLAARDRRLVDAITAAHRRHMPKVARRLQNQLSDDKGILHRLHRWLTQVARERARQAKERAARKAAEKAAEAAAKAARANNKVIRAYIRLSGAGWSAQARQAAAAALGMTGPVVFDRGGWLMPGATLAVNNTRRPEPVGAPGGHVTYNITVNVPPHANQASIGRQIVHSIQQFEKSSGTRWRK